MTSAAKLDLIVNEKMRDEFTFEDVSKLMYQTVLKKNRATEARQISRIGVISGFVDLNGELEVIVKFIDSVEQYTKKNLRENTMLVQEEIDDED